METGIYRIEVRADFGSTADRTSLPEQNDSVIITSNKGIAFATLHRLHIDAKPKKKDKGPCSRCIGRKATQITVMPEPGKPEVHEINYCSACGRRLD